MKRIIIALIIGVFLVSLASAEVQTIGTFKQNTCVELLQTCGNCTYSNITSIQYPIGSMAAAQFSMSKIGTKYNYTYCSTDQLGVYVVNGVSDVDGIPTVWAYDFKVTPSGSDNILGFFILLIIVIYAIAFIGFFGKSPWVAMLGGMAMLGLGLFTINNGVDVFRNQITDIFSWTTIGLGAFFALYSGIAVIQENYN